MFEKIYAKFSDRIYRFLYWHTRDPHLAEDLTSDVFERALKHWDQAEEKTVQAWLYRIAGNLVTDNWRKKKAQRLEGMELAYDQRVAEELEKKEAIRSLGRALDRLPEKLKTIVIMRFVEDYSAREVGEMMGLSEGNIRVLQYRALKLLKQELDGQI